MRNQYDVDLWVKDNKGKNKYMTRSKGYGSSEHEAMRDAERNVSKTQTGKPVAEAYKARKVR